MAAAAEQSAWRSVEFATDLAGGVADFRIDDLAHGALTVTWRLSAWMRRCSVGFEEAWAGVMLLRDALLAAAGLDRATEPVPLRAADPKTALVNMTVYLDDLVSRAERLTGGDRAGIIAGALDRLAG